MLDPILRRLIDPPLAKAGRRLAAQGVGADAVTLYGLALGLAAALLIGLGFPFYALFPLLLSRLADGLDGAIARATRPTDFGGYLDITADFLFYGAIPLGFVFANPGQNGAAGGFLLLSFYVNGASFLGYSVLAERHGLLSDRRGAKSLYFSGGLLEGSETILFLSALCLFPSAFPALSGSFGALCFLTALLRVRTARRRFPDPPEMTK